MDDERSDQPQQEPVKEEAFDFRISEDLLKGGLGRSFELSSEQDIADAKQTLNDWSSRHKLTFVSKFGDKVNIETITLEQSFVIKLQMLLLNWSITTKTEPVRHRVQSIGPRFSSVLDLPLRPPAGYERKNEPEFMLPGTDRIVICPKCRGSRQSICTRCSGTGRVTEEKKDSKTGQTNRTTVNCKWCGGDGHERCTKCEGHGEVITFDAADVNYRPETMAEAWYGGEMPKAVLEKKAKGEPIYDDTILAKDWQPDRINAAISNCPYPDLCDKLMKAVAEKEGSWRNRLVYRAGLRIDDVKIRKIGYSYKNERKTLYVYGTDKEVHSEFKPYDAVKIFLIVAFILGILVAGGVMIFLL